VALQDLLIILLPDKNSIKRKAPRFREDFPGPTAPGIGSKLNRLLDKPS